MLSVSKFHLRKSCTWRRLTFLGTMCDAANGTSELYRNIPDFNLALTSCSNVSLWASGSLYLLAAHGVFGLYGIRWLISRNGGSSLGSLSTKIPLNSVNNKSR